MEKDGKIHIPVKRRQAVTDSQIIRISADAFNVLADIYNESSLPMKDIASKLILSASELVVFDKED